MAKTDKSARECLVEAGDLARDFFQKLSDIFDDTEVEKEKEPEEPRYSGNRVCPICGERRSLSSFNGFAECSTCRDEVHDRYWRLRNLLMYSKFLYLLPSEKVYIADMLERMKSGEDKKSVDVVMCDDPSILGDILKKVEDDE